MTAQALQREFSLTDEDFRFLSAFVHAQTGIVLAEHKRDMVYTRIARRLRQLGLSDFSTYCAMLEGPGAADELSHLVNAITTNLTSFFREEHHFDYLRDTLIPQWVKAPPAGKRLRIWSAGCSAGAEAYSTAMTLLDALPGMANWDCKILATDIDTGVLATGTKGEYPADWVERIPPAYRKQFMQSPTRMGEAVRGLVHFRRLNLLESWPVKGQFQLIFCRNVVIYFDKETQARLFNRFADQLAPGGHLFIGHSESLGAVINRFEPMGKTMYRLKP